MHTVAPCKKLLSQCKQINTNRLTESTLIYNHKFLLRIIVSILSLSFGSSSATAAVQFVVFRSQLLMVCTSVASLLSLIQFVCTFILVVIFFWKAAFFYGHINWALVGEPRDWLSEMSMGTFCSDIDFKRIQADSRLFLLTLDAYTY